MIAKSNWLVLFGSNREYIEQEIPHISSLMRSTLTEVLDASEVIVIGKKDEEFRKLAESPHCSMHGSDAYRCW